MFSSINKFFLSSSLDEMKRNALRELVSEGHSCNFFIDFDHVDDANTMMFEILGMQHEKTIHTIIKIEKTSLSVSVQHELQDNINCFVEEICRKAIKIKNG